MNIYFDTEFTGLVPNTTLVSLGCIDENENKFYAEFLDYDKTLCNDWIRENVLSHLYLNNSFHRLGSGPYAFQLDDKTLYVIGDTNYIRTELTKWLNPDPHIVFVSDVCHYDFYLLCNQVFGGACNLPNSVVPACYDICQDLIDENDGDILNMGDAFKYSREGACKFYNQGRLPDGQKHNALYDAEVIKMIFEGMHGRRKL